MQVIFQHNRYKAWLATMTSMYFTYALCGWIVMIQIDHHFVFIVDTCVRNICEILEEYLIEHRFLVKRVVKKGVHGFPFLASNIFQMNLWQNIQRTLYIFFQLELLFSCWMFSIVIDEDDMIFFRVSRRYLKVYAINVHLLFFCAHP